jgi:hypothetical protein
VTKPNVYEWGSNPEIILAFTDTDGVPFIPPYTRLSIVEPDGTVFTVSGAGMTVASGYLLTYIYEPRMIGWHEYYGWGDDNTGREILRTHGFEIVSEIL